MTAYLLLPLLLTGQTQQGGLCQVGPTAHVAAVKGEPVSCGFPTVQLREPGELGPKPSVPQRIIEDEFERAACKALSGAFGPLPKWKRTGYTNGLKYRRKARLWVTYYGPHRFPRGAKTSSGLGCSERVVASNVLPRYSFVFVKGQLRQVLDCGAKSNDKIARRRGGECWIDLWLPGPGHATGTYTTFVIPR